MKLSDEEKYIPMEKKFLCMSYIRRSFESIFFCFSNHVFMSSNGVSNQSLKHRMTWFLKHIKLDEWAAGA